MTQDDIIRMAREAGVLGPQSPEDSIYVNDLERFAALVAAAEREKVATWMIQRSYATGHGDTIEDLLAELDWQIKERIAIEREACIDIVARNGGSVEIEAAIRARGQS